MRIIKYDLCTMVNTGTEEEPVMGENFSSVTMDWSEANEEIARAEAYEGKYTVTDDGEAEPTPLSQAERILQLEQALEMILSEVTE